jgi:LacI family transcriptional regulator
MEHRWIITVNDGCTLPDGWRGDGIITYFDTRKDIIDYVTNSNVPVVNLSGFRPDIPIPSVTGDNIGIGEMAADFFLKKGFTRAAYFSTQFHRLQKLRLHGFARRWFKKTGNKVFPMVPKLDKRSHPADDWTALGTYIKEKLTVLPKPLAVFAYCDYDAAKIETAALEAGLRIPEDIAVLGVDNDPLVCENDVVPISSVCHDRVRIGYEGAALLEKLMSQKKAKVHNVKIMPTRIEERASTSGVYSDDPLAQRVIAYFNSHLSERTGVQEMAVALGINRRSIERHFAGKVGHPISYYLRELRLSRAYQMIRETDRKFGDIALECGFSNAQHLSNSFRSAYGIKPSTLRSASISNRNRAK